VQVAEWKIERGPDWSNDPSVSLWLTLADWPEFEARHQARNMIIDYVRDHEDIDYVNVYYETVDETASSQHRRY
jgi:hypothetical protein